MMALFELALLGGLLGLPAAQADPSEECCGLPRNGECTGCIGGYLYPPGNLYGCCTTGVAAGCELTQQTCNSMAGPIIRWRSGSNCLIFQELNMNGVEILMPGCPASECE